MPLMLMNIPRIMRANGWRHGAALLETWFSHGAAVKPEYGAPVTDVVSMDWALSFRRARQVYDHLMKEQVWLEPEIKRRIGDVLGRRGLLHAEAVSFGDLARPIEEIDADSIYAALVRGWPPLDDMFAALGDFYLRVAVAGTVEPVWWTRRARRKTAERKLIAHRVTLTEVGVYARGSYDFDGARPLGSWNESTNAVSWGDPAAGEPVTTTQFRDWRDQHRMGGDFLVYSDVKRTVLSNASANSFTVQATDWLLA